MESGHQKKLVLIKDSFLNYYMKYKVCMNIKHLQLSLIEFVLNTFSTLKCNFPFLTGSF